MSATINKSQILWERADNLQKRVSFVSRALFMLTNSANKQNHESPKLKKTIFRRECHKNTPKYGSHCDAIIQKKLLLKTVKRRMENEDSVNDHMISALSSIPFTPSQFPLLQAYDEISWVIDRSTKSREFSPLEWKKPKPPKPSIPSSHGKMSYDGDDLCDHLHLSSFLQTGLRNAFVMCMYQIHHMADRSSAAPIAGCSSPNDNCMINLCCQFAHIIIFTQIFPAWL